MSSSTSERGSALLSGDVDAAYESLRQDAGRLLTAWSAPDAQQNGVRSRFLSALESGSPAMRRDGLPAHFTASALVLSAGGDQVLLTLHRKARRWLQLGGHLEPSDPSVASAALREAQEESGLSGIELGELVDLDEH